MKNTSNHNATPALIWGGDAHKLLKQYRKKAFYRLIKSYKRYYLGSWLFKLPAYKLIAKETKIQKWRDKRVECYNDLQLAKKYFRYSKLLYSQSKAWVESSEFKEKYLDINHPYPPLLNPQNINYESIPAGLAWELNLPLPPKYDFIYLTNGASASDATCTFLDECGVSVNGFDYTPKASYLQLYKVFTKSKIKDFVALPLFAEAIVPYPKFYDDLQIAPSPNQSDATKLIHAITKKVPLLYIARCPIGRAKHIINHIQNLPVTPLMKRFNLTCDYTKLFPRFRFFGGTNKPSFVGLRDYEAEIPFLWTRLLSDSLFRALKDSVSEIYCVKFNDLKPSKAFKTFCNVATKFTLHKPQNKEIFLNRITPTTGISALFGSGAVEIYVHIDDIDNVFIEGKLEKQNLKSLNKKGGYSIFIAPLHRLSKEQRNFADISSEIASDLIFDDTQILIVIQQDDLNALQSNQNLWNTTKQYLKGYIQTYKKEAQAMKDNRISESQLLDYLRSDKKARELFKKTLDSELNYIKTHHSDFIQKWKYYLEFEKMCAELDGTDSSKGSA